ncbi:MAG: MBL fold metallo-hydrolase [Bryobacteraceae bacterium]
MNAFIRGTRSRAFVARIALGAAVITVATLVLAAQQRNTPATAQNEGSLQVLPVQGNVYLIAGAGGNVVAQVGEETTLLVDTGAPEYSEQIRGVLRRIARRPVGFIINTTIDRDHIGGNEALSMGGVYMLTSANQQRAQSAILSHLNLLNRLTDADGKAFGIANSAFPTDTFDDNSWRLSSNGEAVILEHPEAAHTDSDMTVFFRRSDVIVAGDLFDMTRYPVIDEKRGGSLSGILKTLNHLSADVAVPKQNEEGGTYIVPGHGRICDRYDVAVYRDMLTIIRDRIQDLVKKGQTIDQVKAAKPTYDYDGEFGADSGAWTTNMFVEAAYRELKRGK